MDYTSIFEISASGMDFQRLRLETIANNLANANTTRVCIVMGTGKNGMDAFADKVSNILPPTTATIFLTHLELPESLIGSNCSSMVLAEFNDW